MRFRKQDLLDVAELLNDAYAEGYKYLVTPRERRYWSERDFFLLWNKEDAYEFADFKGDWFTEELGPIMRQFNNVADRYDIGETVYVFREHELSLGEGSAYDDLRSIGVTHALLAQDIYELESDPGKEFFSLNIRNFGPEFELHLYPRFVNGKLRIPEYGVVLPKDYGALRHMVHNGIDSRDLEKRFASIDWVKENGADFKTESHSDCWELVVDCRRFQQRSGDDDAGYEERSKLVDGLMCRYFRDTEMERQLFDLHPDSFGLFYDTVMFPKDIKLAVAASKINEPALVSELSRQAYLWDNQKTLVMNLNNLENLREEMKNLGFKPSLIEQMEEKMKANTAEFKLYDSVDATRGRVDVTLFFKQSSQSDYYYLNKFEVCHEKGRAIPEGHKIMVLTQTEGTDKGMTKSFVHIAEGIEFFNGQKEMLKEQKGISHLVVGKDANSAVKLATMEDGKVNYVQKEFGQTYRTSPINQTIYVEKGKGFSAEQAINMIQGRAVYRDDMVSQAGQQYKAWIKLDFDVPKDRFGNFMINQYTDPAYGFDLSKVLDKFDIKELVDPAKREILESSIRNGNRAQVTVEKNGEKVKLDLEAVPRYSQINLYTKDGKPEKREQFLKQPDMKQEYAESRNKSQEKNRKQGQGLGV